MTNTSIKFAGGVSANDAHTLARNMGTTAEAISAVRKRAKETEFAVYVRNHTDTAVTLSVPLGTLEAATQMNRSAQKLLTDENRRRVTSVAVGSAPQPAESQPPEAESVTRRNVPRDGGDDWRS